MPARQSLPFRVKKQVNDLLRRLTGYQFVKATKLEALEAEALAAARAKTRPRPRSKPSSSARRRR